MSAGELAPVDGPTAERLHEVLAGVGGRESQLSERFYEIFLGACPAAAKLFGAYAMAEQEAMFREVLQSLLAWSEGADWLAGNLEALGGSHREYGVEPEMFDVFSESLVACAREQLPELFDEDRAAAVALGLAAITAPMREAVRTD